MSNEIQTVETSIYSSESAFELAQRQAKALCASSIVPDAYRGNIPNTMIAMEIAVRTGASVMAVMQNLCVIHGKPSFEAKFIITQVNNSPHFGRVKYKFSGKEENDSWGCRAMVIDKEDGELLTGPKVTMEMARKEGWLSKKGSKWQTMPELMLQYRAASFWQRIHAAELTMGFLSADEMRDVGPAEIQRPRNLDEVTAALTQPTQEQLDEAIKDAGQ